VHTNSPYQYDASLWIISWICDPAADKLPEDGTLMPKHVGFGTECEVGFMMFHCIVIGAFCWFKIRNEGKHTVWLSQSVVLEFSTLSLTVMKRLREVKDVNILGIYLR
jgi:hypothetical protein